MGKGLKYATSALRSPLKEDWPQFVTLHCIDNIVNSVRLSSLLLDRSTLEEEEVQQNLLFLPGRQSYATLSWSAWQILPSWGVIASDNDIRPWSSSLRSISFLRPTARPRSNLLAASTLRVRINYEEEEETLASHAGLSSWLFRSFLSSRLNVNSWSSSTLDHGSWEADVT